MSSDLNRILVVGRLGKKPELRSTKQGTPVCNFSLATNSRRNDREETLWLTVVTWGNLANTVVKYLDKGARILVEGELQMNEYKDKNQLNVSRPEIIANRVLFLEMKKNKPAEELDGAQLAEFQKDSPPVDFPMIQ